MPGVCRSCGDVVRKLHTCQVCSAQVCSNCREDFACNICHGHETMDDDVDEEGDLEDQIFG